MKFKADIDPKRLEGLSLKEQAKLRAAYAAIDENVCDGQVVGVGSGSTIVYAVDRLVDRVHEGLTLTCIPTSYQALQLIRNNGLRLSDLSENPEIDITIDGADEITRGLVCIKGGGGCHVQEKIVASNSKRMVVICDYSKVAENLGTVWKKGVPIEVIPMAIEPISLKMKRLGGKPTLRMAKAKAGPVVSDNGNFVLDVDFGALVGEKAPEKLNQAILNIPGVVDTGLFLDLVHKCYVGTETGSVETW